MFQQTQFLDIIFLALVAFFLFMRLRSVLGTRPEKKENAKMSFSDSFKIVDISEYRTLDKSFAAKAGRGVSGGGRRAFRPYDLFRRSDP